MPDVNFQNLSTVQSNLQPGPVTVTAAATLAPTTFLTFVSGTTALATITPPVSGSHMLAFAGTATNWSGTVTTGNILVATASPTQNKVVLLVYNPAAGKYMPVAGG